MLKAAERAHAIGADALQVFADNPTAWKRRAEPPSELSAFRTRLAELGIGPLAIHASYLVNLAGPSDELYERSVALLAHELGAAPAYGARFVNVHIGSHKGTGVDVGVHRVAAGIARAMALAASDAAPVGPGAAVGAALGDGPASALPAGDAPVNPIVDPGAAAGEAPASTPLLLVLENSAGGGDGLGTSVEEIERILAIAEARGVPPDRLGLCLDTAHAWAAGHDLASPAGVDDLLGEIDRRIGLGRLVMIHLNDSKAPRGSRLDRHEHVGAGEIGAAGLARILTHPALAHVTYYLETPGMDVGYDAINLARARDIAAGRPLAPLPPGAHNVRGARARTPAPT